MAATDPPAGPPAGRRIGKRSAAADAPTLPPPPALPLPLEPSPDAPAARPPGLAPAPPPRDASVGPLSPSIAWVEGGGAAAAAPWETPHLGADGSLEHRLPAKVGPYLVLGEIARGGMGIVVRARHEALGRDVALKLLRTVGADEEARARFLLEARTAARLRHPGIVQVHDVVTDPAGRAYLVMDLVEGQSLRDLIQARGTLPPGEAAQLLVRLCEAVEHAHAQGVVHRDLKPHNVLVAARTGQPLLTDFGLAKVVKGGDASSSSTGLRPPAPPAGDAAARPPSGLTRHDVVLGTPRYMAPEQVDPSRGPLGPATDVYGLGGILHECLTGDTPFGGDGATAQVFVDVLDRRVERVAGAPPGLEEIVLRCLEKSPRARYRSAGDLRRDLERWLAGRPTLGQVHVSAPRDAGAPLGRLVLLVGLVGAAGWLGVTRAWPALAEALAGRPAGVAPVASPAALPPPPAPATEARPLDAGPLPPPDLGRAPGLRLSPEPLATGNIERLAGEGYADALLVWGHGRLTGTLGGPADPALGRRLVERAAEAGLPQAALLLGELLRRGAPGLPPDPAAARRWLERGAELGSAECMTALALALVDADTPADDRAALRWLEQAGRHPEARRLLGELLGSDRTVADPRRAAAVWREDAAAGSAWAMYRLGQAYSNGRGVPRDAPEALRWLRAAAAAGSAEAMLGLAQASEVGLLGLPRDLEAARRGYAQAEAAGSAEAGARLRALPPPRR